MHHWVAALVDRAWLAVATGERHTCAIKLDGTLWCFGANEAGQVGTLPPTTTPMAIPMQVGTATWRAIAASNSFTCGIQTDDTLWCWGSDTYQELGLGAGDQKAQPPGQVMPGATWREVSTGNMSNNASCWGHNATGQLGIGNTTQQVSPANIGSDFFLAVSAGESHTCGLRSPDGAVMCWGYGAYGQLGNGTTVNRAQPTAVMTGEKWKTVEAGGDLTCATTLTDALYCWGSNEVGQVGDGGAWRTTFAPIAMVE